jgi:hypothetical protein
MGLIVEIKDIQIENDFEIWYSTGRTPGLVSEYSEENWGTQFTGGTSVNGVFSGETTTVTIDMEEISENPYDTQFWFKLLDKETNNFIIENIYIHNETFYSLLCPPPTPTPTLTNTPTISLTSTSTPTLTSTPTNTLTSTPTNTPTQETPTPTPTPTPTQTESVVAEFFLYLKDDATSPNTNITLIYQINGGSEINVPGYTATQFPSNCTFVYEITGITTGDSVTIGTSTDCVMSGAQGVGACPAVFGSLVTYTHIVDPGPNYVSITVESDVFPP